MTYTTAEQKVYSVLEKNVVDERLVFPLMSHVHSQQYHLRLSEHVYRQMKKAT